MICLIDLLDFIVRALSCSILFFLFSFIVAPPAEDFGLVSELDDESHDGNGYGGGLSLVSDDVKPGSLSIVFDESGVGLLSVAPDGASAMG